MDHNRPVGLAIHLGASGTNQATPRLKIAGTAMGTLEAQSLFPHFGTLRHGCRFALSKRSTIPLEKEAEAFWGVRVYSKNQDTFTATVSPHTVKILSLQP